MKRIEFKGTKGDWETEHRIIDARGMYSTEVYSGNTVICTMHWAGEQIDKHTIVSNREANAHLIASAPDLLKALQLMVNNFQHENTNGAKNQALLKAESAINKALNND